MRSRSAQGPLRPPRAGSTGARRPRAGDHRATRARPRRDTRAPLARRGLHRALDVGIAHRATTTACRRASTGTAATSERAAASSSRSVKTTKSARASPNRPYGTRSRSWYRSARGSRSKTAPITATRCCAGRSRPGAGSPSRRRRRRCVTELVGTSTTAVSASSAASSRVRSPIPPTSTDPSRGGTPRRDPARCVLVAHRTTGARGRGPVT